MYSVQKFTLYAIHCILYTVHCTLDNVIWIENRQEEGRRGHGMSRDVMREHVTTH